MLHRQHLLAFEAASPQLRFMVKTLDALVVHEQPVLAQLQVDHPDAVVTMALRERHDGLAYTGAAIRSRGIRSALALICTTASAWRSLCALSTM